LIWKQENMLKAFTTLIPVFVTPLLTIYALGAVSPIHRSSGWIGLTVGSVYGFAALISREFPEFLELPSLFSERWMALIWSLLITSTTVGLVTLVAGTDKRESWTELEETGWLGRSRDKLPAIREHPFKHAVPVWANATIWAWIVLIGCTWVVFGCFW
jgi:hypothetical protein